MENTKRKVDIKTIARIGIFGALAAILYCIPIFQFKLPSIFPNFLEFHFDEIPIFIASFAYGPLTGFFVILVRTLIKLPMTSTLCVGEISDFLYSCALILPAAFYYKKHRTIKGALIGITIGFFSQIIISALGNGLFMIDFYLFLFKISEDSLLAMVQGINPAISDIHFTLILYAIIPFNALKNLAVIIVTILVYKKLSPLLVKMKKE